MINMQFFNMKYYVITNSLRPKGQSGESCGSRYSLDFACKNCGTGAQLLGNLNTRGLNSVNENFFSTLDGDFLISMRVYSALISNGIVLHEVSQVEDHRGNPLDFYHLNPRLSFPKLLPQSQGLKVEDQCPVCKQNGYFNEIVIGDLKKEIKTYVMPLTFHYGGIDRDFLSQSDIFHTWEHLGLSNLRANGNKVIRYARPLLIVTEKVREVFEDLKLEKISFSEVIIHHAIELQ
ncbi:MAG TPA: hypothetical protein VGD65_19245 [Chryseosolibacter sp.]